MGQGFSKGYTVKGDPGGARTPVVALAPLLALPPHCASDPLAKAPGSCGAWLCLVALGPQELGITLPTFPAKPVHWPLLPGALLTQSSL